MPGLVTIFSPSVKEHRIKSKGRAISRSLFRADKFDTEEFGDEFIYLHLSKLPGQPDQLISSETIVVAWAGTIWYEGNKLSKKAIPQIGNDFEHHHPKHVLSKFEGQFQLIVYDFKNKSLYVVSDKISSHPFYYYWHEGRTIIAPEVFSFNKLISDTTSIRTDAVYEFLMSGHLWGDGTYLDEVYRLGPGQFLKIDESGLKKDFYYTFDFSKPAESLSKKERSRNLYDAVHADLHKLPKDDIVLTLSGGLDSRALLGFLRERQMNFDATSYSYGEPLSELNDAGVARDVATKNKLNFEFYRADLKNGKKLIEDLHKVVKATGGECDAVAAQDALLGESFYETLGNGYQTLLRGDEVWGWGDYAFNRETAFIENYMFTPNELTIGRKLLNNHACKDAVNYVNKERKKLSKELPPGTASNDLKDFLYWRHREARLLQTMAYYRRGYINQQAPFLYDNTLRNIQQVPAKSRIRKIHFVQMAKMYFPDLFNNQRAASAYKKGPDKYTLLFQNKELLSFMKDNLITNPPRMFHEIVDIEELGNMFDRLSNMNETDRSKKNAYNIKRFLNNALRKSTYLPGIAKYGLKKMNKFHFPVAEKTYLYRVFILALALKRYEEN